MYGNGLNHAYLRPSKLPILSGMDGVEISEVRTEGKLPTANSSLNQLENVLAEGAASVGEIGMFVISCGFEEKNSMQNKNAYDTVLIRTERGKKYFCYRANGSRVQGDVSYRKEFLLKAIDFLNLPVFLEYSDDFFKMKSNGSGALKITKSEGGGRKNPSGFNCELVDREIKELAGTLSDFIVEFASDTIFDISWRAGTGRKPNKELSQNIFDTVVKEKLPAESFELDFSYTLNELGGIELLQNLCGPKDQLFTSYLSMDLPERNRAEATIKTTNEGHRLEVMLTDKKYISEVQNILNIELVEC